MSRLQKDVMEDSVEIVIEKLLHVTKDAVPKVIYFPSTSYFDYYSSLKLGVSTFSYACLGFK